MISHDIMISHDNSSSPSSFESCWSKLVLNFSKTPRPKAQILEAGRFSARYSWHLSEIWGILKSSSSSFSHIFPMKTCELGTQKQSNRHKKRSFPPILPATHVEISRTSTFEAPKREGDSVSPLVLPPWLVFFYGEYHAAPLSPAARRSPASEIFQESQHLLCWCPAGRGRHWPRRKDVVLSLVVPIKNCCVRPT